MSEKCKKVCTALNYIQQFLIIPSTIIECFNYSFCFFGWNSYRSYEFYNRIKTLCNNSGIKKYKSKLRKKEAR